MFRPPLAVEEGPQKIVTSVGLAQNLDDLEANKDQELPRPRYAWMYIIARSLAIEVLTLSSYFFPFPSHRHDHKTSELRDRNHL